jgi:Ran GTPase-activating protein (RanGAP) involved in mRNA processing and transport
MFLYQIQSSAPPPPPQLNAVSTCVVPILRRFCLQNEYVKPIEQIHTYDAEDVFEFLNPRDHEITRDNTVEIRKQSSHEEVEEPESLSSERTTTVLKLSEGLGLIEDGI